MGQIMRIFLALYLSLSVPALTCAQTLDDYANQAVERLSAYLQIDTINPPGNESRGVRYIGSLLDDAGIAYETVESAPGVAIYGPGYLALQWQGKTNNQRLCFCIT